MLIILYLISKINVIEVHLAAYDLQTDAAILSHQPMKRPITPAPQQTLSIESIRTVIQEELQATQFDTKNVQPSEQPPFTIKESENFKAIEQLTDKLDEYIIDHEFSSNEIMLFEEEMAKLSPKSRVIMLRKMAHAINQQKIIYQP